MKRHYWVVPQQRVEHFIGMQKSKEVGPWVEVGMFVNQQQVELNYLQPDLVGADFAQTEQLPIGQHEPDLGLYL